jgi:uncharacterized protein YfaT (DUF1175 family)
MNSKYLIVAALIAANAQALQLKGWLGAETREQGEPRKALPPGDSDELDWEQASRLRIMRLALQQSYHMTASWDPAQRDCAGFVRFLYREAGLLKQRGWVDRSGTAQSYVGADELLAYNFAPLNLSPDDSRVQTGDVIAYYNPAKKPSEAWHIMVLVKSPPMGSERVMAIYHNGESGVGGTVKRVWLDDLMATPIAEWRPRHENSRYLGTFRWRGWSSTSGAPGLLTRQKVTK